MRGSILDRNGQPLAKSLPGESICVNPFKIPDPGVAAGLSTQSITLAPGQTQSVTLNLSANASAPSRDYTGLVIVTGPDGQALLVPYWVGF